MQDRPAHPPPPAVPETSWSLIVAAQSSPTDRREALDRLCRRYWAPLYAFARRQGLNPADAEDATQDFFVRILSDDWLNLVDRTKGRFRGYLYQSMTFHLSEARRHDAAQKRGGGARHFSIDRGPAEEKFGRLATTTQD
ncbi:MAG: sigma-70 family RNA polymerase sigma factor, partial [Verrucomicrobia bacterium]|nr:sigma-70 family RNA polymerase sigma factor [Verrucomicrobiota bacterium]